MARMLPVGRKTLPCQASFGCVYVCVPTCIVCVLVIRSGCEDAMH